MQVSTVEFQAKCLELMEHVKDKHEEVVITKSGKPVAKLAPVEEAVTGSLFGFMKGTVTIHGDIISSVDEKWNADYQSN